MIRRLRSDDRGTSLVIVLMIITFVSTVMGVVLSQEGTSVKATEVLRSVNSTHYGADAAGQAVVTQLANGQFACASTGTSTLPLGNGTSTPFYTAVGTDGGGLNAVATCTPDTTTGVATTTTGTGTMVGPANTPSATITSVGTTFLTDGVVSLDLLTLCVQGSVVSYTSISGTVQVGVNSSGNALACPNTTSPNVKVQAFGNPALGPGTGCVNLVGPTPCTALGATIPPIPTVPDPGAPITTPGAPVCSAGNTYAAFMPGLYTVSTSSTTWSLSTPCSSVKNGKTTWVAPSVEWFSPGVYYFDFGATTWTLPAAFVGGTPATASGTPIAGLNPTSASTLSALSQMPSGEGKCIPPTAQTQAGMGGVEFVFGGASTMTGMSPSTNGIGLPNGPSTDMDICATYSATSPPVAIYGVYQQPLIEAGGQVSAESGCVATPGCASATRSLLNWPVVGLPTLPVAGVDQTFHIDGYVWAPAAALAIDFVTPRGQAFNWGTLTRTFRMYGLTLLNPTTLASVPAPNAGQVTSSTYSVRYVKVWTCTASASPCAQTGQPDLQIKVQQSGSTWKVISWSSLR